MTHDSDAEDKLALAKILDAVNAARKNRVPAWSSFLDPAKAARLCARVSKERGVNVRLFGGFGAAERKMLGVCPDYSEITDADFPIDAIEVSYDARFGRELTHRDFLGSVLGLGIDRSRVGDIVLKDNVAHAFVCREISGYVLANLERVGRAKVSVRPGSAEGLSEPQGGGARLTVASLRLDVIISAAFRLSRGKSAELIAGEKVFVNWALAKNTSAQVSEGDMITARGLGRVKLAGVAGKTKKDRVAVNVVRYG